MPALSPLADQLSHNILCNVTSRVYSIHSYPVWYYEREPCPSTSGSPGRLRWFVGEIVPYNKTFICINISKRTSLVAWLSEFLTTNHEVPGSIHSATCFRTERLCVESTAFSTRVKVVSECWRSVFTFCFVLFCVCWVWCLWLSSTS